MKDNIERCNENKILVTNRKHPSRTCNASGIWVKEFEETIRACKDKDVE